MERAPEPVSKAQLLDLVWPGLVVEENNLQVQVSTLRKLLGPQAIVTIPGRGYSFTMPRVTGPRLDAAAVATPATERAGAVDGTAQPLQALIGRQADQQAVVDLLDRHRLVAITGAGGIGKTRLARAVFAARLAGYTDGASFIELAPLGDPALVAATIAAALQVSVGTARPALQAIVSSLRNALRPFNG